MKRFKKHTFEAVSLLTADKGLLDISVIPAEGQPDWLIPTNLILEVVERQNHESQTSKLQSRLCTYHLQGQNQASEQEIPVFHLIPPATQPTTLIVLEGNSDDHRIALQTAGQVQTIRVSISDLKDVTIPDEFIDTFTSESPFNINDTRDEPEEGATDLMNQVDETILSSYLFQCVEVNQDVYLVPDIDKISHYLVTIGS